MTPAFKYHPNPLDTGMFTQGEPKTCCCCGRQTDIWYDGPFYGDLHANRSTDPDDDELPYEKMDYLCPECIADGSAAAKFQCVFQDGWLVGSKPEDAAAQDEWKRRTPGYYAWQSARWYTHCNEYCAFLGSVGWEDIVNMGLAQEIEETYDQEANISELSFVKEYTVKHGSVQGFLFRCLHCGRHFLWLDMD